MRIAEAGTAGARTCDERHGFRKREAFLFRTQPRPAIGKKSLHLVMIQLLCYPIHAKRSPMVCGLTRGWTQQGFCQYWPPDPRSSV
jgi:hypothetical protein